MKRHSLRAPLTGSRLLRVLRLLLEETLRGQTQSRNPERQFNVVFYEQQKDLLRMSEPPYEMRTVEAFDETVTFWHVTYNKLVPF